MRLSCIQIVGVKVGRAVNFNFGFRESLCDGRHKHRSTGRERDVWVSRRVTYFVLPNILASQSPPFLVCQEGVRGMLLSTLLVTLFLLTAGARS